MIPANVMTALNSLQAQVIAAMPLEQASRPTITALQLNAAILVGMIDQALANAATLFNLTPPSNTVYTIDTWQVPTYPEDIINGLNSIVNAATDQWRLSVMRGVLGRVAANLDQVAPVVALPVPPLKIYAPQPPAPPPTPPPPTEMATIHFLGRFARQGLKAFPFNQ